MIGYLASFLIHILFFSNFKGTAWSQTTEKAKENSTKKDKNLPS